MRTRESATRSSLGQVPRGYTKATFRRQIFKHVNRGDVRGLQKFIRRADKAGISLSDEAQRFMNNQAIQAGQEHRDEPGHD